ncbi:MAG: hypothetical protein GY921_03565 [Phycisphaeraceae bacterium]|nr:hypothetical protein [Phycisphaeraceae bacterium]
MSRSYGTWISVAATLMLMCGGCGIAVERDGEVLRIGGFEPWAEPIPDALAVGEVAFEGDFDRGITTLRPFEGRLWMGYGDATRNLGSEVPVEFRWFAGADDPVARTADVLAAGQGARQRSPGDTGEEQIEPYRVVEGSLWQPGVDSTNPDEAWTQTKAGTWRVVDGERVQTKLIDGNVFKLESVEGEPVWRKYRNIPGGEHVHDIAGFGGSIYAVGSGADHRFEFGNGKVFRYLWRSDDGGETFRTVLRVEVPAVGYDTRFRRLLASGDRLYVLGYLNPYQTEGPIEGRSIVVTHRDGITEWVDLEGPLAEMLPLRTFEVPEEAWGLVIASKGRRGAEKVFRIDGDRVVELEGWRDRRVIDVSFVPGDRRFLVLAGTGRPGEGEPTEQFEILSGTTLDPDRLSTVARLSDLEPRCFAVFDGHVFLGTDDGRILRADLDPDDSGR